MTRSKGLRRCRVSVSLTISSVSSISAVARLGDTLLYFDRTPLGYPFHFGGLISTINSDSIEDIRIYAGGYGAEFGLDSQSVIDIRSRERLKKNWAGVLDLNILSPSGFRLKPKLGDKGYASLAGRFTTLNLILDISLISHFPTGRTINLNLHISLHKASPYTQRLRSDRPFRFLQF